MLVVCTTVLQVYTGMVAVARQLAGVHRVVGVDPLGNAVAVAVLAADPVRGAEVCGADGIEEAAEDEDEQRRDVLDVSHIYVIGKCYDPLSLSFYLS